MWGGGGYASPEFADSLNLFCCCVSVKNKLDDTNLCDVIFVWYNTHSWRWFVVYRHYVPEI